MNNYLQHWGILGMKWGIRRSQEELGHLTKKDKKWVRKNQKYIEKTAKQMSKSDLDAYADELMSNPNSVRSNGKISSYTINQYNRKMADLMSQKTSSISSPSGKVVRFVAKRGELGVYMALADQGYNMDQLKNGVWDSGRIAYKKKTVDRAEVG